MKTSEIIHNLLSGCPAIFRRLHSLFGFDFQAPFGILYISGKFTVNGVLKQATASGYTKEAQLVLLSRSTTFDDASRFYLAAVNRYGKVDIDFKNPFSWEINNYYAKSAFEAMRKYPFVETYVIWQNWQYLKEPVERAFDKTARYKLVDYRTYWDSALQQKHIGKLILTPIGENRQIEYNVPLAFREDVTNVDEIIDKSGYLLLDRRIEMYGRARILRAQRKKAAFVNADFSDKVTALAEQILARNAVLIAKLTAANTAQEISKIPKALSSYRGFANMIRDFEIFRSRVENKDFQSIADCEKAYQSISSKLAALAAQTQG